MATLAGNTIASTYPLLLKVNSNGLDGTLRAIQDGDATDSVLYLATDSALISGNGTKLYFFDADGGEHISANNAGVLSIAGASEIDLTATAIDINGTVDMSSTLVVNSTTTIKKALSSDTQTTPETILTLGSIYSSTGSDGGAGSGARLEFNIPDDDTNPITGSAIAGLKENADDGISSSALAFYTSQDDTTLDEAMRINSTGNIGIGDTDPSEAKLSITGVLAGDIGLKIDHDIVDTKALYIEAANTTADVIEIGANSLTSGRAMLVYSSADRDNTVPLVKLFDDNGSNDGTTLEIRQDGPGHAMLIDQNANDYALEISGNGVTSGTVFEVGSNTIEGGTLAHFYSSHDDTTARNLVKITNDDAAATGAIGLKIQQDSTTAAAIRSDGGKIEFINTSLSTTASFLGITNQINKTAGSTNASDDYWGMYNELQFSDADAGFGHLRGIYNEVKVDAADGTEATNVLGIENQLVFGDGDVNILYGHYNLVDVNAGQVDSEIYGSSTICDIESGVGGVVNVFAGAFTIDADTDPSSRASVLWLDAFTNCDFSVQGYNRPGDTLSWQVTFDGVQTNEGAINTGGLDYAEYFESKDGKSIAIGTTVKLDDGKIVACEEGDTPIGVVRPVGPSAMIGGDQTFHWQNKFVKDDYGATVWESYTLKKWSEEITEEEYHKRGKDEKGGVEGGKVTDTKVAGSEEVLYDGYDLETSPIYYKESDELPEGKSVGDVKEEASKKVGDVKTAAVADTYFREHKYQSDKLPEGVTPPDDAKTITPGNKRQKVNSDYDPSKAKEYKSREEREEWHIIGLLGQIQITKGQPMAASWIKMKDISDTVEMYFVK